MRRFLPVVLSLFFVISTFLSTPSTAHAACTLTTDTLFGNDPLPATFSGTMSITISGDPDCSFAGSYYVLAYPKIGGFPENFFKEGGGILVTRQPDHHWVTPSSATKLTTDISLIGPLHERLTGIRSFVTGDEFPDQPWTIAICKTTDIRKCTDKKYFLGETTIQVGKKKPTASQATLPKIDVVTQNACTFQAGTVAQVSRITNLSPETTYWWWWEGGVFAQPAFTTKKNQTIFDEFPIPANSTDEVGSKKFCIEKMSTVLSNGPTYVGDVANVVLTVFTLGLNKVSGLSIATTHCDTNGILLNFTPGPPAPGTAQCSRANAGDFKLPDPARPQTMKLPCAENSLVEGKDIWGGKTYQCKKVNTAIGDIDTNPADFVKKIFSIILSLAGGILLLIIIATGYRFMTSQGDPEKLKAARETLTSAVIGLLFMIFALVILQVVGVDILKIPGFGK